MHSFACGAMATHAAHVHTHPMHASHAPCTQTHPIFEEDEEDDGHGSDDTDEDDCVHQRAA